jgi:hypothetical protein
MVLSGLPIVTSETIAPATQGVTSAGFIANFTKAHAPPVVGPSVVNETAAQDAIAEERQSPKAPSYQELWDALEAYSPSEAQTFAKTVPLDGPDPTQAEVIAGGAVIVGVICGVTLGLGCVAAIGTVAVAILIYALFGQNAAPTVSADVLTAGEEAIDTAEAQFQGIQNQTALAVGLLNDTADAWDQAAAAAAEYQLANPTFNTAEDLVNGSVATQIGNQLASWANQWVIPLGGLATYFDNQLGLGTPQGGYGCPLFYGGSANNGEQNGFGTNPQCGHASGTGPSSGNYIYGKEFGGQSFAIFGGNGSNPNVAQAPLLDLVSGSFDDLENPCASDNLVGYDLTDGYAVTLPPHTYWDNWTVPNSTKLAGGSELWRFSDSIPSGGCGASSPSVDLTVSTLPTISITQGMAVNMSNYADTTPNVFSFWRVAPANPNGTFWPTYPGAADYSIGAVSSYFSGLPIGCSPFIQFGGGGQNIYAACYPLPRYVAVAGADYYLLHSTWNLEKGASEVGQAYWFFLRALGYRSISQIPANCLIPFPDLTIDSNVPPSVLATGNWSQIYNFYLMYLTGIGHDFNVNITNATFCGTTWPKPIGNVTAPWSQYGYGYIYIQNGTSDISGSRVYNANGTIKQSFQNVQTWNVSGAIYLEPQYVGYSPKLNTTWLLARTNPVYLALVYPFTTAPAGFGNTSAINDTLTNGRIVANGPSYCAFNLTCEANPYKGYVLQNLVGNSTIANGSAFPHNESSPATPNDAVVFTGCFAAVNWTSGEYSTVQYSKLPKYCQFSSTFINPNGTCGNTSTLGVIIGTNCRTPPPPVPPPIAQAGGLCATFLVYQVASAFQSALSGIPLIGSSLGFDIGCVVGWIILIALLIGVGYAVLKIGGYAFSVRKVRGGRSGGGGGSANSAGQRTTVRVTNSPTYRTRPKGGR